MPETPRIRPRAPRTGPVTPLVRLVELPVGAMSALLAGDLDAARRLAELPLTPYFTGERSRQLWHRRIEQIRDDPTSLHWVARAAIDAATGQVVGHAGFHGPPDGAGMVEVGYSTDPDFRRRGYARAMVRELLAWATGEPNVRIVRASISPGNAGSLATIDGFGFARVGEQWDEDDGLELLFELRVRPG